MCRNITLHLSVLNQMVWTAQDDDFLCPPTAAIQIKACSSSSLVDSFLTLPLVWLISFSRERGWAGRWLENFLATVKNPSTGMYLSKCLNYPFYMWADMTRIKKESGKMSSASIVGTWHMMGNGLTSLCYLPSEHYCTRLHWRHVLFVQQQTSLAQKVEQWQGSQIFYFHFLICGIPVFCLLPVLTLYWCFDDFPFFLTLETF